MTRTIFIAAALALAVTLPAAPAQAAGAPRTFVSAAGSDSNNCTNVATPCRHMAAAYAATAANGEIYVLDPANYGSLTITHAVSIEGHGWASIAPVSGQAAITINANPGDAINIIGVVLDGTALAGTTGIQFNSGGSLNVKDSVIRNFTGDGIAVSAPAAVSVADTILSSNTNNGISFQPSAAATLMVERVQAIGNGNLGFLIDGTSAPVGAVVAGTLADCVASGNGDGILGAGGDTSANPTFSIVNCKIANNTNIGILTNGSIATLAQSTISNNKNDGFSTGGAGGVIRSFGNNFITDTTNFGSLTPISQR
jgi:hypothetical protein